MVAQKDLELRGAGEFFVVLIADHDENGLNILVGKEIIGTVVELRRMFRMFCFEFVEHGLIPVAEGDQFGPFKREIEKNHLGTEGEVSSDNTDP